MRIDGFGRVAPGGADRPKASAASAAFRLAEPQQQAPTGGAAPLRQAAGLDALIALQGVEPETPKERRRKALRRGRGLLDALDGMKIALLEGREQNSALASLASRVREQRGETGDEALEDLLSAIDLRVQVELAKRGQ